MVEKGIGRVTANGYLGSLRRFYEATKIIFPDKEDVVNYLMGYYDRGLSYSYIVNTTLALEHYLDFQGREIRFDRPRKPKLRVEDWLTEQEIARMFVFCENIRESAMLALLSYTGIRNQELCDLLVKNLDFESQTVFIKAGKGLKDGRVCIAPAALNIIMEYLKAYPRQPHETVLFSIIGSRVGEKMRTCSIRKHIKKIAYRAGIERRVWPHLFRHSLAMNMLLRGCDLYSIKEQMRHEFISTTEIYIKSNPQILRNNYPIFVPQYVWGQPPAAARMPNYIYAGSNSVKFNKGTPHRQ